MRILNIWENLTHLCFHMLQTSNQVGPNTHKHVSCDCPDWNAFREYNYQRCICKIIYLSLRKKYSGSIWKVPGNKRSIPLSMSIKRPSKFNLKYYATIGSKSLKDTNLIFGIVFKSCTFKSCFLKNLKMSQQ